MAKEKKFFMWQWKWSKMEGGDGYTILNRPKAIEWCKQVNFIACELYLNKVAFKKLSIVLQNFAYAAESGGEE